YQRRPQFWVWLPLLGRAIGWRRGGGNGRSRGDGGYGGDGHGDNWRDGRRREWTDWTYRSDRGRGDRRHGPGHGDEHRRHDGQRSLGNIERNLNSFSHDRAGRHHAEQ